MPYFVKKYIFVCLLFLFSAQIIQSEDKCSNNPSACTTNEICIIATTLKNGKVLWQGESVKEYVLEAKKRNLTEEICAKKNCRYDPVYCSETLICKKATRNNNGESVWKDDFSKDYIQEAKSRGLSPLSCEIKQCNEHPNLCNKKRLCKIATTLQDGKVVWEGDFFKEFVSEAKSRGYKPGRFSFNVKGGRCEACEGDGVITYEMHFLPDVYVTCDECKGSRYNRETLEIKFKGKSIAEVLDMTVEEGCDFFENIATIRSKLLTLKKVGLGYIKIGQQATTLSGGEAQRIKLAKELSKRSTGRTIYILDEPTTGLHQHDIKKLLEILHTFVATGNTVVVIEHNLDVIKTADYVVDMGPDGGVKGGQVIAEGKPEDICNTEKSYTGKFLKPLLNGKFKKIA